MSSSASAKGSERQSWLAEMSQVMSQFDQGGRGGLVAGRGVVSWSVAQAASVGRTAREDKQRVNEGGRPS